MGQSNYREALGTAGWTDSSKAPVPVDGGDRVVFINADREELTLGVRQAGDMASVTLQYRSAAELGGIPTPKSAM